MASSSSCWPWTSEAWHPVCSPIFPQLPLHPPRRLSPLSSLSCLGRDDTYSRDEALGLGTNNAGAEESPVLTDDDAELPLQLRPASWSTLLSAQIWTSWWRVHIYKYIRIHFGYLHRNQFNGDDSFLLDCDSKAPQILDIYWHMASTFNSFGSLSSTEPNLHKTKKNWNSESDSE